MVTPRPLYILHGLAFPLTLRLLVAMVQNYICGVIHPSGQVLDRPFAELIHPEHVVVDVGDAVDVVFKDVDAEGLMELCGWDGEDTLSGGRGGEPRIWPGMMEAGPKHSTVLHAVRSHDGVAAVQPHAADQGEFGVGPVQALVEVVHGQTWRETQMGSGGLALVAVVTARFYQLATGCFPPPESLSWFRPSPRFQSWDGFPSQPSTSA